MALLICMLTMLPFSLVENDDVTSPVAVLFDAASPEDSVGVIENQLVEIGSIYENYRILTFDHDAVILETLENKEAVRLPVIGELDEKVREKARYLFIVKQLRKVYEAQDKYFEKHGRFSSGFETLIREGFIAASFKELKEGYRFTFVPNEYEECPGPQYRVLAAPSEPETQQGLFFSVGALGLVRSGVTEAEAHWGPAWDYSDHSEASYKFIGVD